MVQTRKSSRVATGSTDNVKETQIPSKSRKRSTLDEGSTGQDKSSRTKRRKKDELETPSYSDRVSSPWKIGAHVSAAGGIEKAVHNAAVIGANAFALFVKSQRKWTSPPLSPDSIEKFKSQMNTLGYSSSHVLPHGSYLINLGNPDEEKREKSYQCFLDDLQRCELLGLELYNFHPGSTVGQATKEESISLIAASLNRAHKATSSVVTVIENMAGAGNIIGSLFEDLAGIIRQVEDKSRVGVCLDTCHMFAAVSGFSRVSNVQLTDFCRAMIYRLKKAGISDFDTHIGLSYLRGLHMNDSKTPLASKKDRHENIGMGHLGLRAFHHIVTDPRLQNIPLVLETPSFETTEIWTKEIEVLNRLSDLHGQDESALLEGLSDEIKKVVQSKSNSKPPKKSGGGARKKRHNAKDSEEEDELDEA
ncbi:hypothetical protein SERLA73DRAFT_162523 [Serpula lacrymans var. lacrymans S7.3]|uniref:Apurinic-apyrimidinic endonuclease 1 n=1 Tax=Serpula lacrymans var. lacrymans (strain S7.3) TaxID=936435 RepID=F8Q891_SERL3|nr:hypothetical protein SERLA73DRAFT_162523 [Serpula lacrymans var. lacrymans S7.3]